MNALRGRSRTGQGRAGRDRFKARATLLKLGLHSREQKLLQSVSKRTL